MRLSHNLLRNPHRRWGFLAFWGSLTPLTRLTRLTPLTPLTNLRPTDNAVGRVVIMELEEWLKMQQPTRRPRRKLACWIRGCDRGDYADKVAHVITHGTQPPCRRCGRP